MGLGGLGGWGGRHAGMNVSSVTYVDYGVGSDRLEKYSRPGGQSFQGDDDLGCFCGNKT